MHPCVHVTATGLIGVLHAFSTSIDTMNKINYLMSYTIIDTFFIFSNIRRNSLLIHHFVTLYMLLRCKEDENLIEVLKPLVMLEVTTFFNSLNQCCRTNFTRVVRNVSWVSIRMIYLPVATTCMVDDLIHMRYLNEAYCVLTILILSYEWSLELLKIRFTLLPLLYYYVEYLIHFDEYSLENIVEYVFIATICISRITSYEMRLVAHLGSSLFMRKAYLSVR